MILRPSTTEHVGYTGTNSATEVSPTEPHSFPVPGARKRSFRSAWKARQVLPDTYEEYRAQEPPQARLIRLRGLFDTLLDHDDDTALAGGRAKQEWRERASRARYGAGGSLATGSLVSLHGSRGSDAGHVAVSASATIREWFSFVRRQSYASELLARSRTHHAEMEKYLAETQSSAQKTPENYMARLWHDLVQGLPASTTKSSEDVSDNASSELHKLESGWRGSRVWGLLVSSGERNSRASQSARQREIEWEGFLAYAEVQERELYKLFKELDRNHDGQLDEEEISHGFDRAGIHMNSVVLEDFVASLASYAVDDVSELHGYKHNVTFPEFRDYLLLLPRKPSMAEILRFYQVRKAVGLFGTEGVFAELGAGWGKTSRGASAVNHDGDVSLAGDERMTDEAVAAEEKRGHEARRDSGEEEEEAEHTGYVFHTGLAFKFLLAGGIAGAVSRTSTAPLDRLKVYMITNQYSSTPQGALRSLAQAVSALYAQGGLRTFWLGNGLNCIKIFPESAIKFFSYETAKRMFAKHVDHVSDSRDISSLSRFISGGIGGICSQLAIYPVETLKTRLMSSQLAGNAPRPQIIATARQMYLLGGMRSFYRGLGAGLIGVFPYSAIDMSTFEGIKLFYMRYTGKDEPGVFALLAFGSVSGSVGATTVYPLNLVRTRLQAAGTPAHPVMYKSFWDAAFQTYQREGFFGFYRGLVPSLAKVVPAVSISYVVYEQAKRQLGVIA
ncbi:hypothetical protein MCUN1_001929 [Malassezia cuniculi]|uniref:EF-hand domain-containing protein n=1 Tax=Malassezia cuniculi TaxID=948313 RepID=A0AAF0ERC0_9BASI|nr:hypothetical protein MCUN1_001929 [Malassezia cuniculi]